jgi:Tfp pilus assembly protein PilN
MKREINLITDEFIFDPLRKIKPKLAAGWLICLILGLGWLIGAKAIELKNTNIELTKLNATFAERSKEEQDLALFIQKNGQAENETSFQEAIRWIDILKVTGSIVPEGAWLKSVEGGIKKEGTDQPAFKEIKFNGFAVTHAPVTLLLSRLERQPLFSHVRLIYTLKGEVPEDHYIHFEITGKIN